MYSVKNNKRIIKTKVTIKQNLEHFKMIDRRSFIPKFYVTIQKCCCHPPGQ